MGSQNSKNTASTDLSRKKSIKKYPLNNFAAITVLFNPFRNKTRYELYEKFRQHISRSAIRLFTVECIFDNAEQLGLPKQRFQVTRSNNDFHLQIVAPSLIWLKENLINIAVKHLPSDVEYIAWLDADIEFEQNDWPHLAIEQLKTYSIVQLFESASFLGPRGKKQVLRRDYSFVYAMQHGIRVDPNRSPECYVHPGYAWATRRETFDQMGGLLDFSIVGAGDLHFAYALFSRVQETLPSAINADYRYLTKMWADKISRVSGHGYKVGYVPLKLYHHWHGDRLHRGYKERWLLVEDFGYSPLVDLEKNDANGLIRLSDGEKLEDSRSIERLRLLQMHLIKYFKSRQEDNTLSPEPVVDTNIKNPRRVVSSKDIFRPTDDLQFHYHASSVENVNLETRNYETNQITMV